MTPHFPPRSSYSAQLPSMLVILICAALTPRVLVAATYHVNPAAQSAADTNPGTETTPWKTISRAASAQELQPGDTVMVHSGVYREHVEVKVSGQPERPITFTAAPGARVVLKGSEMARGRWQKLAEQADRKEPYPNAFTGVWRLVLGDEYFTDARFQGSYQDKTHRWVSQVFINDNKPLQRIGLDPIYKSDEYLKLAVVGRGLADMIEDSFFFDPSDQSLCIKIAGEPAWFAIEVGVRGFVLTAENIHDVVIRGLELRHNRQPGGQWPMVSMGQCERVVVEDCRIYGSDFCGLGLGRSRDCVVRRCDLSYNGNTGLGMGECRDCTIEDCTTLFTAVYMGCPEYGPYQRTVASNHADYNVYANTGWTPTLRHSWNPDNTLAQWQERFQEDLHSTLLPVEFELTGTRFAMKTCQGLNSLAPLPDEVCSVLPAFTHAGCRRIQWPPKAE